MGFDSPPRNHLSGMVAEWLGSGLQPRIMQVQLLSMSPMVRWRNGSAAVLQADGSGFKSLADHHLSCP